MCKIFEVHLGINGRGLNVPVSKDIGYFLEGCPFREHGSGEAMTQNMGAAGGLSWKAAFEGSPHGASYRLRGQWPSNWGCEGYKNMACLCSRPFF